MMPPRAGPLGPVSPRNVAAERTEPMEPLEWIWVIAATLLGAAVGSFVNVVMYRLPRNLSVSKPRRSFCPVPLGENS